MKEQLVSQLITYMSTLPWYEKFPLLAFILWIVFCLSYVLFLPWIIMGIESKLSKLEMQK